MKKELTKTQKETVEVIITYFMHKKDPEWAAKVASKLIMHLENKWGLNNEARTYSEEYALRELIKHLDKKIGE